MRFEVGEVCFADMGSRGSAEMGYRGWHEAEVKGPKCINSGEYPIDVPGFRNSLGTTRWFALESELRKSLAP